MRVTLGRLASATRATASAWSRSSATTSASARDEAQV